MCCVIDCSKLLYKFIIIIIIIKVWIIILFLPVVNIVFVLSSDTVYFQFGRWLLLIQSTSAVVFILKIDMTMRMEQ